MRYKHLILTEMRALLIFVLVGFLVGACGILGIGERTVIGGIGFFDPLVVPDSVMAGKDFRVTVTTTEDGCTLRVGKTDVEIDDNVATITPYVIVSTVDDCALMATPFHRYPVLRFPNVGEGTVILRGRDSSIRSIVTVTRTVVVY